MNENVTALQIAVLGLLADAGDRVLGAELRDGLTELGKEKSRASFYQLMARLEKAKLVKGKYIDVSVGSYKVQQREYVLTSGGRDVLIEVAMTPGLAKAAGFSALPSPAS